VAEALAKEKKRRKKDKQAFTLDDERQRGYNSLAAEQQSTEVSPEEFEAYRLSKMRSDDPMAGFM